MVMWGVTFILCKGADNFYCLTVKFVRSTRTDLKIPGQCQGPKRLFNGELERI